MRQMSMIERVEAAIQAERHKDGHWTYTDKDLARAAIAAMREPTAAMLEASPIHWDAAPVCDMWRAMIDAASEGK